MQRWGSRGRAPDEKMLKKDDRQTRNKGDHVADRYGLVRDDKDFVEKNPLIILDFLEFIKRRRHAASQPNLELLS